MKVKDFMIHNVFKLNQNENVKSLLETMVDKKIGGVPIVDDEEKLVRIITDGDVLRYLKPFDSSNIGYSLLSFVQVMYYQETIDESVNSKKQTLLKDVMKKRIISISEDDSLENALKLLSQHKFKKLPVVNKEHYLIGVISRGDLIRQLAQFIAKDNSEE